MNNEEAKVINNNQNQNHPTQSLPPPLRTIRRSFELLSISYFLNIFGSILSIHDFSISKLEADLDGSLPDSYTPSLIPKLLVALTGDRSTNHINWESRLRREFLRREPTSNPLGEEPIKLKPRFPKRAVGYVYIAEPIPLTSLSSVVDPNSQSTQPIPSHSDPSTSWQPTIHRPHTSIPPSDHPQTLSESEKLSNPPAETLPKDSLVPSKDQQSTSSNHPLTHQSLSSESTPSLKTLNQDENLSESIQPKQTPLDSSENSSPAPQQSQDETSTTKTWSSLSPTVKLKTLFKLCEWHFSTSHDLERFRRLVDLKAYSTSGIIHDDQIDWRQERCGTDSLGNQYWIAGQGIEAKLWIQRREPQPPRKSITLRIPARTNKKAKGATSKDKKRRHSSQEKTQLNSSTLAARRSSNPGPLASKRPRLAGTRSSMRLRASQVEPPSASTPPRPPTMIVIKKTSSLSQKTETSKKAANRAVNGSARPSPRQRERQEVWQAVPPGWLEEVVEPNSNSKSIPSVFSSDLSDMSDEDDQVQIEQNKPTSSEPILGNLKTIPPESEPNENNVFTRDESLSDLTESPDASTVVTCDSVSSDVDPSDSEMNQIEEADRQPIVNSVASLKDLDDPGPTSGIDKAAMIKGVDKPTSPETRECTMSETPCGLENSCEKKEIMTDSNSNLEKTCPPDDKNGQETSCKRIPSTNGSSLDPTAHSQKDSTSNHLPESSSLGNAPDAIESTHDEDLDALFPEMKGHPLDPNWIEWEVICSNLNEWKQFGLQFSNSDCQSEKLLNEYINGEVLPELIAAYEAEEARIQKEEAMAQQKRSTRSMAKEAITQSMTDTEILLRESTRMHSSRLEAKRLREIEMEEAKNQQKEEDQRLIRLKEREERIALREAQLAADGDAELKRAERARLRAESKLLGNAVKVARPGAENSVPSIDSSQQWKLNCEICGITGINMDDGSEVICCDECEDWQHLNCHDKADEIMRRPKRDWSTSDFICSNCSGIPIPRAVKKFKINLKSKIKPRLSSSSSSSSSKFTKNNGDNNNINHFNSSDSSPVKSHKLTILLSNPNKLGGTSLSQVFPNSDLSNENQDVSSRSNNGEGIEGDQRWRQNMTNNHQKPSENHTEIATGATQRIPTSTTTTTNSITENTTTSISIPPPPPSPPVIDLSMYYNDLEKLRKILKVNTNLHRSLPTDVMKRLRNYLIDQQTFQQQQQQDSKRKEQVNNNNDDDLKKKETSSHLIHQTVSNCNESLDHTKSMNPGSTITTTAVVEATTTTSVSAAQDTLSSSSLPAFSPHHSPHLLLDSATSPAHLSLNLPLPLSLDPSQTDPRLLQSHPQFP